jgi:hypothetical protein
MKQLFTTPLEHTIARGWARVDTATRHALAIVVAVSVAAFGFEMTNLTFHHDDSIFIFVQDTRIGSYLGRFAFGWMHYYTQNAYIMPFLQLAQAIALMALCGLASARLWSLRGTLDVALVSALICVFPYMAQIYQYNFCTVPFAAAHLLAATAALLSTRATAAAVLAAAALYAAAFSVYQAVLANAVTLLAFWLLARVVFDAGGTVTWRQGVLRPAAAAAIALAAGGVAYVTFVSLAGGVATSYQGADEAFKLRPDLNPVRIASMLATGTRSFFVWPEPYFPGYLKQLQLLLVAGAALVCVAVPRSWPRKAAALVLLALALVAPRTLQLLHPGGSFHNLTLTAYAVAVAGCLMLVLRGAPAAARNAAAVVAAGIVAGYVIQSNWISTVNLQNTTAHFAQATQVLTRARSLPASDWDGKTIVVAGSMPLFDDYPFRRATGVAPQFIRAQHLQRLAHLLRDPAKIVSIADADPSVQALARTLPPWPHPSSVTTVDGVALVVLSAPRAAASGRDGERDGE